MATQIKETSQDRVESGPFYTIFVDDIEHRFDSTPVTGAQIMDKAGIPHDQGLLLLLEDGTQQSIGAEEEIELKPGRRFKKAPHFRRG